MDYSLIEKDLRNAVSNAVGKNYPVAWPNSPFNIPNGSYMRFNIVYGDNKTIALSELKEQRCKGVVIIQLFSLCGIGTYEIDKMCDIIIPNISNKVINSVSTRSTQKKIIGESGTHYQVNLQIPFSSDQQGD